MKIDGVDGWPEECIPTLERTKFELLTDKEWTGENIREYYGLDDKYGKINRRTGVILISNTKRIKSLDRQIPTLFTTYRQYILDTGLVDIIIEENDGFVKDDEAHLFFYFYKNPSSNQTAKTEVDNK